MRAEATAEQKVQAPTGLEKTCLAGRARDCYELALAYDERRPGASESGARAARFYDLACKGGDLRGCENLAVMYLYGEGVVEDGPRAVALTSGACEAGSVSACFNLGVLLERGEHVPEAAARAAVLYQRGCDAGMANACHNLAELYTEGRGVARDPAKAVALDTRTCEAGFIPGCVNLGFLYEHGEGVERDPARALALYAKACDGGEPRGCYNAGITLREGDGVPTDQVRAMSYSQKGCDGGFAPSCYDLGAALQGGVGGTVDLRAAAHAYERGCTGDHAGACRELGVLRSNDVDRDAAAAARLFEKACAGDDATGCANLGVAYRDGLGVERDADTAVQLFEKACDGGEAAGCYGLGVLRSESAANGDPEAPFRKALGLFQTACDTGEASACNSLGLMHVNGYGVAKDAGRAFAFYNLACKGGDPIACSNVGYAYEAGSGVAPDPERAVAFYRRACDAGAAVGCSNLAAHRMTPASEVVSTSTPTDEHEERRRLRDLAAVLTERERFAEVVPLLEQLAALDQARGEEGRTDLARDRTSLGACLSRLGRTDDAISALRQAEEVWAAVNAPRDHLICLATLGQAELVHGRHVDAEEHLKKALALAKAHGLDDTVPVLANNLGLVYQNSGRYEQAIEQLEIARDGFERRGAKGAAAGAYGNIGWIEVALGRCEEGIASWRTAVAIVERTDEPTAVTQMMVGLGLALKECSLPAEARAQLEQGQTRAHAAGQSDIEASALTGLGDLLGSQGLLDQAEADYKQAIDIFRSLDRPRELMAATVALGGVLRTWGRTAEALKAFASALAEAESRGLKGEIASNLLLVGGVHEEAGRFNTATLLYERALALAQDIGQERELAVLHNALGRVFVQWGKLEEGEKHLKTALAMAERLKLTGETARILVHLGALAQKTGDLEAAQDFATRALELAREAKVRPDEASALNNLGLLQLRPGHYKEAQKFLLEAIAIKEQLRESAKGPDRISTLDAWVSSHRALVLAEFLDGDPVAACDAGERMKARYLAEQIQGRVAGPAQPPPGIEAARQTLPERSAIVSFLNVDWEHPMAVVATRETVRAYTIDAPALRTRFLGAWGSGRSAARPARGQPARSPCLQQADGAIPAILEEYRQLLSLRLPSPSQRRKREWLAHSLFGVLLAPAEDLLATMDELIVIPDGSLYAVPLETLRLPDDRYLVERHHVRYLPSLQVRALLAGRRYGDRPRALLAVGGVPYDAAPRQLQAAPASRSALRALRASALERLEHDSNVRDLYAALGTPQWKPLPWARLEVEAIGQTVPGSTLLSGAEASEKRIKALSRAGTLRGYRALHFATHGLLVPDAPELSALVLAEVAVRSNEEDGYLTAAEVGKLDIRADFVALSACETGRGKIFAGDGAVGLTQAFLEAGANGVAVSLWQLFDAPAKTFMAGLYERVQAGTTYARAVTEMKRRAIGSKRFREPVYWAPFVYYGKE